LKVEVLSKGALHEALKPDVREHDERPVLLRR